MRGESISYPMKRLLTVFALALCAIFAVGYVGDRFPDNVASTDNANGIVGVTATDKTLIFAQNLLEIQADLSGFVHYYFSSQAGGDYPLGDDLNPCTRSEPCFSWELAFNLISSQKHRVAVMDSGDTWSNDGDPAVSDSIFSSAIATPAWDEGGSQEASFQFSTGCDTGSDELCLAVIGSDPYDPWTLDLTNTNYVTAAIRNSSADGWAAVVNVEVINTPDPALADPAANCTANNTPFSCCTGAGAGTCVLSSHDVFRTDATGKLFLLNASATDVLGESNQPYTAHDSGQGIFVNFRGTVIDDSNATTSGQPFAPVTTSSVIDINGLWIQSDLEDDGTLEVARVTGASSSFHVGSIFQFSGSIVAAVDQLGYSFNRSDNAGGDLTMIRTVVTGAFNTTASGLLNYAPGAGGADTSSVRLINTTLARASNGITIGNRNAADVSSFFARCLILDLIDAPSGLNDYLLDVVGSNFATTLAVDIAESWVDDRQGGSDAHDRWRLDTTEYNCRDDAGATCDGGGTEFETDRPAAWTVFNDALSITAIHEALEVSPAQQLLNLCSPGKTCEAACDSVFTELLHPALPTIPAFVFGDAVTQWRTGGLDRNMGGRNP